MTAPTTSLVLLVCLVSAIAYGQGPRPLGWTKMASPAGDVTFSIPDDFLVDRDSDADRIYFRQGSVVIAFSASKEADPKSTLKSLRNARALEGRDKFTPFTIGEFEGDVFTATGADGLIMMAHFASRKGFYRINASASSAREPVLERFVLSIRLGGLPLIKQKDPPEERGEATSISSLKTSPSILDALKRRADEVDVEYLEDPSSKTPVEKPMAGKYSKPVLILRQPGVQPTEEIREYLRNLTVLRSTSVRLRITLAADGTVGSIAVLGKPIGHGLTSMAIKAAKDIKFLPAEVDGKPVAMEITSEYTFTTK